MHSDPNVVRESQVCIPRHGRQKIIDQPGSGTAQRNESVHSNDRKIERNYAKETPRVKWRVVFIRCPLVNENPSDQESRKNEEEVHASPSVAGQRSQGFREADAQT